MESKSKIYARNIDGLIDACFDQLQDLRDGISNANETIAFAKAAEIIVHGVETDLKAKALMYAHLQRMEELSNQRLQLTYEKSTQSQDTDSTGSSPDRERDSGGSTCTVDREVEQKEIEDGSYIELHAVEVE